MSSSLRGRPTPPDAACGPSNKKENLGMVDRRQRKRIVVPANGSPARQVLWSVNAGPNPARVAADQASSEAESMQFASREDVEKLLGEKIDVKNKNDYKGKSKQLTEYTKKLRLCVKWLMELEDGYLAEQEKLRNTLNSEEERHRNIETQMKDKADKLHATIEKLQTEYASLEEKFVREESDKSVAIRRYNDEKNAKLILEDSYSSLTEELDRVSQDARHFSDQLKMLQETNKRMQEYNTSLQQYNSTLQADAVRNGETISKLQVERIAAMESLASVKERASVLKNQLDELQHSQQDAVIQKDELKKEVNCLRKELQQVRGDRDSLLAQVQSLTPELTSYKEQTRQLSKELDDMASKTKALEETCTSQNGQIQLLQHQLGTANDRFKRADLTATEVLSEYEEQQRKVKDLQDRLADAELQVVEGEKLRKKLHNTILELKGNIRVFCRVRPVLPYCGSNGTDGTVVSYPTSSEFIGRGIDLSHNAQKYSFTFDKVFNQEASQEDVYEEISQLVQSALDGYKVCIFAYGQTGSGKTYTMVGDPKDLEKKGLIPRSLEQIFETSQSLECQGWKYKLQASMLEIYNESIRDLLSFRSTNTDASAALGKQYSIKHDPSGNTFVSDLVVEDVCNINQVNSLLLRAAQSRSVAVTQSNEQSSRSHFVFILRIFGINESTEQQVEGWLNLIDLAGSERLAKSGSVGDRLKETQSINKSLSALCDVIFAIAKKDEHVPFRNSKLTYLLQPCLGGDSKTLMFVNISPETSSSAESVCSLRFASRVNSCEIGVPRRQTQTRYSDSRLSFG